MPTDTSSWLRPGRQALDLTVLDRLSKLADLPRLPARASLTDALSRAVAQADWHMAVSLMQILTGRSCLTL